MLERKKKGSSVKCRLSKASCFGSTSKVHSVMLLNSLVT